MQRSRKALRQALLALVEEKSYEQISVREIATRAGLSFPTFYRQFPTKEALMDDIAAEEIRELLAITLPLMDQRDTQVSSLAICNFVMERKTLWRTLLTTGATATLREEFIARAREIGLSHPRMNPGLPLDLMSAFVVGGIFEILSWWLRQSVFIPGETIAQLLDTLVLKPSAQRLKIEFPAGLSSCNLEQN